MHSVIYFLKKRYVLRSSGTGVYSTVWGRSGCRRALPPCGTAPRPPSCSSPTRPSSSPCRGWEPTMLVHMSDQLIFEVWVAETALHLAHTKSHRWCGGFLARWDAAFFGISQIMLIFWLAGINFFGFGEIMLIFWLGEIYCLFRLSQIMLIFWAWWHDEFFWFSFLSW